jgi:hypothetical protein
MTAGARLQPPAVTTGFGRYARLGAPSILLPSIFTELPTRVLLGNPELRASGLLGDLEYEKIRAALKR